VSNLGIKLDFAHVAADQIQLSGVFTQLSKTFSPSGSQVIVDVGGVIRTFTLDAKGRALNATDSFSVSLTDASFTMSLQGASFASQLGDEGLVNIDVQSA